MCKWSFGWPVAFVIAMGAWLRHDALGAGFWSDDYLRYAMLHGEYPLARASWDLFRFSDGSHFEIQRHLDFGSFPFWTDPHFKLGMLRPLASLSHAFDYRWFAADAFKHHVHTFLWWGLSVAAVAGCLRFALSWPNALLAVGFYALDEAHSVPVVWLSNRSVLMATALGFTALYAHLSWRGRPRAWMRVLSIATYAAALACGEYALSMFGYFAALELLTPAPEGRKVRSLAPFLGLSLAFVLGATLLGYGCANSGIYASPVAEPVKFLSKLIVGVPVLSADLALAIPADWWTFGAPWIAPEFRWLQLGGGVLVPVLAVVLLRLVRSGLTSTEATNARWLALGAWLSLVPVTGSFISTRLLVIGSVGAAALVATIIVGLARRLRSLRVTARIGGLALMIGLIWLHGVRAPRLSLESTRSYARVALMRTAWALTLKLDPRRASQQRVIQIAAFDASDASYLPFLRASNGLPMPRSFRVLSPVVCPHRLSRPTDRVLELEVQCPFQMPNTFGGGLTRPAEAPFLPGSSIRTEGMNVHIVEVQAGQPSRLQFEFDVPLEDPSLVFVETWEGGLRQISPPKLGASFVIEPPRLAEFTWHLPLSALLKN